MSSIVLDADALIKLTHAGILGNIPHQCFISDAVFEETVTEGKKRLFDDAFEIERQVKNGNIDVIKVKRTEDIPGLGKGELSSLALFKQIKADAIISDDRRFLTTLEMQDIPFITPTQVIVTLSKKVGKKETVAALDRIKPFVTKESYQDALSALGDKK